jgi:hypothetical protein
MRKPTVMSFGLGRVQGFGPGQDMGRIDGRKGAIPMSTIPIATSTRTTAFSRFNEVRFLLAGSTPTLKSGLAILVGLGAR